MVKTNIEGRNVILDAFADEAALKRDQNKLDAMFSVMHALGMKYWTPRLGFQGHDGVNENITTTTKVGWLDLVKETSEEYGLSVICMGTPLGKKKLDGSQGSIDDFLKVTDQAIANAKVFGARALRGFSFYVQDRDREFATAANYLSQIVGKCSEARLDYILEPETGLCGNNADNMIKLADAVESDNLFFLTDMANLHLQGYNALEESLKLLESGRLVGAHVKAYGKSVRTGILPSGEEAMVYHVPVGQDATNYDKFLEILATKLPDINQKIQESRERRKYGLPGFFLTLEPHIAGAGQFRGHSTPRGMYLAHQGLVDLLRKHDIGFPEVTLDDLRAREKLPKL